MNGYKVSNIKVLILISLLISPSPLIAEILPVSLQNPATASSFLPKSKVAEYHPINVIDGDQSTAWVEGVKGDGIGEWIAIYLGRVEELKSTDSLEVEIWGGYQKSYSSYVNNGRPEQVKLELFVDTTLIAKGDVTRDTIGGREQYTTYSFNNIISPGSGLIWLRVTILKVKRGKKWDDTAISEIICNFKNANPHNVRNVVTRFANAVENQDVNSIQEFTSLPALSVLNYFSDEFTDEISCDPKHIRILSETVVELYCGGGANADTWARFEYNGTKWWLVGFRDWWFDGFPE